MQRTLRVYKDKDFFIFHFPGRLRTFTQHFHVSFQFYAKSSKSFQMDKCLEPTPASVCHTNINTKKLALVSFLKARQGNAESVARKPVITFDYYSNPSIQ